MIELRSVDKRFVDGLGREFDALRGFCLLVATGETHCLIGPSGCGKTTTLRLVNRLEQPTAGTVLVEDRDVAAVDVHRLRRRIGYVVQSGGLFPHMTVAQNVGVLCQLEGRGRDATRARVRELLDLVGLPPDDFERRHPDELSGGQRQRVGIARALALDPPVVLMDEPFGALDPITKAQLHLELRPMFEALDKTVLLVTHDLGEAFLLGDRVSLMDRGRIVQTGTPSELRESPANDFVRDFVRGHVGGRP